MTTTLVSLLNQFSMFVLHSSYYW